MLLRYVAYHINFNSHAHVERDVVDIKKMYVLRNFNSHAHVERDHMPTVSRRKQQHFNSHAHVERDPSLSEIEQSLIISTHTLTWSVTKRQALIQSRH